jgi:sugar lactone lactonase YvrE
LPAKSNRAAKGFNPTSANIEKLAHHRQLANSPTRQVCALQFSKTGDALLTERNLPVNILSKIAASAGNGLGEGPLWSPRDQAVWWVDIERPSLWRLRMSTREVKSWSLPKRPTSLALLPSGDVLISLRGGLARMTSEGSGELIGLYGLGDDMNDQRFNDCSVDAWGRLWIGTMDRTVTHPVGALYRMERPGLLHKADTGFIVANGIGWSPDGGRAYLVESHDRRVYAYAFDGETGTVTERVTLIQLTPEDGTPDGLAVDQVGGLWIAMVDRACLRRHHAEGSFDRLLPLPGFRPTSCAFGGADLHTLFVTTARFGNTAEQLALSPQAGALLALQVPEAGLPVACLADSFDSWRPR